MQKLNQFVKKIIDNKYINGKIIWQNSKSLQLYGSI